MKILCANIAVLLLLLSCGHRPDLPELKAFAATETYPDDDWLNQVSNKKALIVVAHDDDDCAMAGTIAGLKAQGWKILQMSLQKSNIPKQQSHPATLICEGSQLIAPGIEYRPGSDTMQNAYLPIPYSAISEQFSTRPVSDALIEKINAFQPAVIFTLDPIKGGYGHPEHIFISQLIEDLFHQKEITVERIYQSVYTDHMEAEIVDKWLKRRMDEWGYPHASDIANEMYGINGMPEPSVQIDIRQQAVAKMNYLRAYPESTRRNVRKFVPYFEEFDAETYFSIFDREFFRIIK